MKRQKKRPAKIVDAVEAEGGAVRLTFTRPHNVLKAGGVLTLHNGPHKVLSVQNRFTLTARRFSRFDLLRARARVVRAMVFGAPKTKARAAR
jgi:hypothetical protein